MARERSEFDAARELERDWFCQMQDTRAVSSPFFSTRRQLVSGTNQQPARDFSES
jgi:hypothetical protein